MSSGYDQGSAYLYFQTVPPSGNDLVSFYLGNFQLSYVPPPTIQTNIPSIYKTYADFFPIGAAVDTNDLSGPHAQLLTMHFDSMTPGNDLKWSSVEPSLGSYNYQRRCGGRRGCVRQHAGARTEPGVGNGRTDAGVRIWGRD
jgi:endo-1,4-beta-xylanase